MTPPALSPLRLLFALTMGFGAAAAQTAQPVINSPLATSGTVARRLDYTLTATNHPTRFNIGPLPKGLFTDVVTGEIGGNPIAPGVTSVEVSANNASGAG